MHPHAAWAACTAVEWSQVVTRADAAHEDTLTAGLRKMTNYLIKVQTKTKGNVLLVCILLTGLVWQHVVEPSRTVL